MSPEGSPSEGAGGGREGFTLVEVLIGLVLMIVGILAVAGSVSTARTDLRAGQRDAQLWSAIHEKSEELLALGYDGIASGTDTVSGFALEWTVTGTKPKRVSLVVSGGGGLTRPDTFVTYLADWTE